MSRPWHEEFPAKLETLIAEVRFAYPQLHVCVEGGLVTVRGTFPVIHDGRHLASYQVEIILLQDYPESLPVVMEIGGRIPPTADRHNPNGLACLMVPEERWQVWPPGSSFLQFLQGPVHNFFLGQTFVECGLPWPFAERSHGTLGVIEYCQELLGIMEFEILLRYLGILAKDGVPSPLLSCPCGSTKRIADCHYYKLNELRRKISSIEAQALLKRLGKTVISYIRNDPY